MYTSYGLLGTIVLIFDVMAIVSLLFGGGAPAHKVLWTVLILLLPLVGMLLYFLIGRGPMDRKLTNL